MATHTKHFENWFKLGAVVLFFFYLIRLIIELGSMWPTNPWYDLLALLFTIFVVAYLAADFFSGIVHFIGDTFGNSTTPLFGKSFIEPFRQHHDDPSDITKHGFVEINGSNCFASLLIIIPTTYLLAFKNTLFFFFLGWFVVLFVWFIFLTNQFHKWAHMVSPPRLVQLLQKSGLILSPKRHILHHTAPFASYFCITSGILNPLLEKIGVFRLLKRLLQPTQQGQFE